MGPLKYSIHRRCQTQPRSKTSKQQFRILHVIQQHWGEAIHHVWDTPTHQHSRMSDQYMRRGKSAYYCGNTNGLPDYVFEERGWAIREREAESEMDSQELRKLPKQTERQIKYRRLREQSLSRDNPPRLPCRPFYENGEKTEYSGRNYDSTTKYDQERVDELPTQTGTLDDCHTCINYHNCGEDLCRARRLTCYYCRSDEGPLRVRAKRRERRKQDRKKVM